MSQLHRFAQKAIIVNDSNQILLVKYSASISKPDKVNGHFGLPGGRIEYGETPDESIKREVLEEAGVTIEPGPCLLTWNWRFEYKGDQIQVNAVGRVCRYVDGELRQKQLDEGVSMLEECVWIDKNKIDFSAIIEDEVPNIVFLLNNWDFYTRIIRSEK